jgi:alkylated DNA nucleotide flippase Atl1
MLASNRRQDEILCYKVVRSDGSLGGYNLGTEEKLRRLAADGVPISDGKVLPGSIFRFTA